MHSYAVRLVGEDTVGMRSARLSVVGGDSSGRTSHHIHTCIRTYMGHLFELSVYICMYVCINTFLSLFRPSWCNRQQPVERIKYSSQRI